MVNGYYGYGFFVKKEHIEALKKIYGKEHGDFLKKHIEFEGNDVSYEERDSFEIFLQENFSHHSIYFHFTFIHRDGWFSGENGIFLGITRGPGKDRTVSHEIIEMPSATEVYQLRSVVLEIFGKEDTPKLEHHIFADDCNCCT